MFNSILSSQFSALMKTRIILLSIFLYNVPEMTKYVFKSPLLYNPALKITICFYLFQISDKKFLHFLVV